MHRPKSNVLPATVCPQAKFIQKLTTNLINEPVELFMPMLCHSLLCKSAPGFKILGFLRISGTVLES